MRSPTRQQRRQKLIEQYVLSRRTMLALIGFACTPGLETLLNSNTKPSEPKPPPNPDIPTLPQKDSPVIQQERQLQIEQTRQEYQVELRLPNSVRVETLPPQEVFSEGYNANRATLGKQIQANQQEFLANPKSFDALDDYAAVFPVLPVPDIANNFRDDGKFAIQRLYGPNPMELTNVLALNYNLQEKFGITDEIFQTVLAKIRGRKQVRETLDSATEEGGLFVTDYAILDTVNPQSDRFITAPIALYLADRSRDGYPLIPIAIQLGQLPGESLLCTPLDGVDWTLAKLIAQMADFYVHAMVRHLGQIHLSMEPIALATVRSLAARHPVNVLLKPHFEFTMAVNFLADERLINSGGFVETFFVGTLESSLNLADRGVSELFSNFSEFAFPRNLHLRGVDDRSMLRDFPYRDDGLLLWNTLEDYVSEYIGIYYRLNRDVREDFELQNWLQVLKKSISDGGFGIASLPKQITNRNQLIDLLTQIIFIAGPQHSAIAWTQYQYMAFIPNMPGAIYKPIPEEKGMFGNEDSLTSFLPDVTRTFAQLNPIASVGTKYDPKAFTDFGANSFQDPRAIKVLTNFQRRLELVEKRILRRNKRRKECYPGFLPSRMANSTSG
ncbi:lipoxygenase family protein [Mastigocoleus sp. MO_188.B34]|uniref:lipoxygenase family protein n=1 Tax=Mastigocoleus sp. MO_188.B34 TaxID=3036635 RepID=UPI00260A8BF9|nr:lipoxygenase family protein [Mastigocoleus sp. MO_188.B34]MDJ0697348.1 lipoxygenase family protein [Mastigocoleus sp. MO_188.B34]